MLGERQQQLRAGTGERNEWLLAAGYAPRYPHTALLRNLERTLARHGSPALRRLAEEAEGWAGIPPRSAWSRFTDDGISDRHR